MARLTYLGMLIAVLVWSVGCGGSDSAPVATPPAGASQAATPSAPATPSGLIGLTPSDLAGGVPAPVPTASPAPAPPATSAAPATVAGVQFPPAGVTTGQIPNAPVAGAPIPGTNLPGNTEVVPAQAGVGIKGRSLDPYQGPIVTPAKTLFTARERIVFEVAVPHALNLYKAENGQGPQSHDEFMQRIIQASNITLPQLPPGHRYLYDPQTEQLMVERPKK